MLDADHFLARGLAHTTRADLEPWQGRELNFNTGGTTGARRTLFAVLGALSRLLDDSGRAGVWPDSVQVIGGKLSMRLPTR